MAVKLGGCRLGKCRRGQGSLKTQCYTQCSSFSKSNIVRIHAPPPGRQQLSNAEFRRPGWVKGDIYGFEAWQTISKMKKAKQTTCPKNAIILRYKEMYCHECSSNCSSNTTDFKIQVIDGKNPNLLSMNKKDFI